MSKNVIVSEPNDKQEELKNERKPYDDGFRLGYLSATEEEIEIACEIVNLIGEYEFID